MATDSATFTFDRNGNPLTLTVTAVFSLRTQQVVYTVVTQSGQTILSDGSLNAITTAFDRFGQTSPGDAAAAQAASRWAVQTYTNLSSANTATEPPPPATASQEAAAAAPQGPSATPTQQVGPNGRIVTPSPTTTPTNADTPATAESGAGVDTNTNPPVKTLEQTQSTNPSQTAAGPVAVRDTGAQQPQLKTSPGVGQNDENPGPNAGTSQTDLNAAQAASLIAPQPNVLDKYSSYSYVASVYLTSQVQYERLLAGTDKKIDGYQLLFQSGGAPVGDGVIRPDQTFSQADPNNPSSVTSSWKNYAQANRNPFFDADFYIDNITLTTLTLGQATASAHASTELKFTVVEPMGITLLNRLFKAVQNFSPTAPGTNKVNYTSAIYLMVIRFYGYDQDGNLVMPIRGGLQTPGDTSDPKAVVEKFIPFRINTINWSVGSKLVSYEWNCTPVGQGLAASSGRGTIPYDLQLTNTTVGALLKGPTTYSTAQASNDAPGASTTTDARGRATAASDPRVPANAGAAPTVKKTVTQGLMGALNEFQQDLVQRGTYVVADEYEIEFLGTDDVPASAIENATLQLPNTKIDHSKTASGVPGTKNANSLRPESNAVDMKSRSFSITAGQQIIQAIELAIRNSSYITDQSLVIKNPDGTQSPSPNNRNKPMTWFNITMSATQKSPNLDPERNDYAYKIKYTIVPYKPHNMVSKYFPTPKFPGVHKSYPFWFTGKNTAVRDYQETLNALYTLTVSGSSPKDSAAKLIAEQTTSSMQEIVKYTYAPASDASRSGADGQSLEANANAAEVLYSPGDLAKVSMKIVGDPAWIMQGSMFKPLTGAAFATAAKTGFEPDGTISFDSQDILFEVVWQRPEDYDIQTGTADPYRRTAANGQPRQPLQSRVYRAVKVVSEFKNGAFDQTLEGTLYVYPKPDRSNTANPGAANSNTIDGSDNRFSRQGNPNTTPGGTGRLKPPNTSDAGAGRSSSQFNATDPRRLDIGDGGKAAILGAQKSLVSGAREFTTNGGGAAFGNPNITRQGVTAQANQQVQNAPPPQLPTSGTGGTITTVAAQTTAEPPKLPESGLTPGQVRSAQVAQQVAELRRRAAAASPTSTTTPNNQKISREY